VDEHGTSREGGNVGAYTGFEGLEQALGRWRAVEALKPDPHIWMQLLQFGRGSLECSTAQFWVDTGNVQVILPDEHVVRYGWLDGAQGIDGDVADSQQSLLPQIVIPTPAKECRDHEK